METSCILCLPPPQWQPYSDNKSKLRAKLAISEYTKQIGLINMCVLQILGKHLKIIITYSANKRTWSEFDYSDVRSHTTIFCDAKTINCVYIFRKHTSETKLQTYKHSLDSHYCSVYSRWELHIPWYIHKSALKFVVALLSFIWETARDSIVRYCFD